MYGFHNGVMAAVGHGAHERALQIANLFRDEQLKSAKTPGQWAAFFAANGEEALKSVVVSGGTVGINYMGQNIVPQDLEATARNLLWSETSITKLLPMLAFTEATNRRHEWPRVRSLGNLRAPLQMPEGGRPVGTRTVTDLAQVWITTQGRLNRITGIARAQRTVNVLGSTDPFMSNRSAILRLLAVQRITHMLWSRTDTTINTESWKGIWQQVEEFWADPVAYPNNPHGMPGDTAYRDIRGHLTRDHIEAASSYFTEQHGTATHCFMSPNTAQGFQRQFEAGTFTGNTAPERVQVVDAQGNLTIGVPVGGIQTTTGRIAFVVEKTLIPLYYWEMYGPGGFVAMEGAPAQPPVPAVNVPVGVVDRSRWQAGDIPGAATIEYRIQAINGRGESLPSASTGAGAVVVAAGGRVTLTWASSPDAESYRILRNNPTLWVATGKGKATFYEVGRVSVGAGGNLTFTDYNDQVAGYEEAILVEFAHPARQNGVLYPTEAAENAFGIADLAGGLKSIPVPSLGDYDEEMLIRREHPILHMPTRIVRFKNVKPYGA